MAAFLKKSEGLVFRFVRAFPSRGPEYATLISGTVPYMQRPLSGQPRGLARAHPRGALAAGVGTHAAPWPGRRATMPHTAESSRCRRALTIASSENRLSPSTDATQPCGQGGLTTSRPWRGPSASALPLTPGVAWSVTCAPRIGPIRCPPCQDPAAWAASRSALWRRRPSRPCAQRCWASCRADAGAPLAPAGRWSVPLPAARGAGPMRSTRGARCVSRRAPGPSHAGAAECAGRAVAGQGTAPSQE